MNLQSMSKEKQARVKKWKRSPRSYRLTKFTINELSFLSDAFETCDTAIIEAAVHRLYQDYTDDKIQIIMGSKSEYDPEVVEAINDAKNALAIADRFNI